MRKVSLIKKASLLISVLMIVGIVLTACGPKADVTSETKADVISETEAVVTSETEAVVSSETEAVVSSGKRKVVYYIGFGTGTAPDQVDGQKALIAKFNESHSDIEVELMIVPHEESMTRFTAMVAGGNAPEVIGAAGFATIGILSETGVIEDLSPLMEAAQFDNSVFYGPIVDIMQSFFPEGQNALPFGIYPSMVFYNKDAFDAAGLPYPPHAYGDESWTYDKVREYAMKLTLDKQGNDANSSAFDPEQIAQWGYDDSWTDMRNYLSEWGAPGVGLVTTQDMKTAIVNQEEWVTGLQWLNDGIWKDHFIPDAAGQATYGNVGGGDPFSSGLVSMFLTHTWYMPEGLTGVNFEYDIAPVPVAPSGMQIVRSDVDGFAIVKGSDEQAAAWEFISWLVQPEQIVDVCGVYGCLPPIKAVESEFRGIMESKWPGLDYDVIYNGLNHLDNPHSDAYVVAQQKIGEAMNNALGVVYSGDVGDAKAFMDALNLEVQAILDAYWSENQ